MTQIELLLSLKNKILNKEIKKESFLKNQIEEILLVNWEDSKIDEFNQFGWMEVKMGIEFHTFLINNLVEIHRDENSLNNKEILDNEIRIDKCIDKLEHGKKYYDIYAFNRVNNYFLIGDIHSDEKSLKRHLDKSNFYDNMIKDNNNNYIFLGDYLDRGRKHLKTIELIMILKYLFPKKIFLLRGNHDGGYYDKNGQVKLPYGVPDKDNPADYFSLYLEKIGMDKSILEKYFSFFDSLAYIGYIKTNAKIIMAVHGGILRPSDNLNKPFGYINKLKDLTNLEEVDFLNKNRCQNLMWSDPYRGIGNIRWNSGRFSFTKKQFDQFREKIGFNILIRGHESAKQGYRAHFNNNAYTIFSSGENLDGIENSNQDSAYKKVNPKILKINYSSLFEFI